MGDSIPKYSILRHPHLKFLVSRNVPSIDTIHHTSILIRHTRLTENAFPHFYFLTEFVLGLCKHVLCTCALSSIHVSVLYSYSHTINTDSQTTQYCNEKLKITGNYSSL